MEQACPPVWEEVGGTLLKVSSFFALCAFVPAAVKKKRVYTVQSTAAPPLLPPVTIEVSVEPIPPCSTDDAASIRELFETIATRNPANPFTAHRLYQIGGELRSHRVHPFEFLKQAPREHAQNIFRNGNFFKTEGVMFGVREGMNRERENLERYIPAFAAAMGKSAERLRQLTQGDDWRGIVDYVFDIKL